MSLFRLSLLLTLILILPACGPRAVTTSEPAGDGTSKISKAGDAPAVVTSDDVLTSAIYQLRPENFGINAATDKPVSLLNSWRFKQIEAKVFPDDPVPVVSPPSWSDPQEEPRLAQPKFDTADAVHVRDALFNRAIAGYLSDRGREESQRAGIIVDFVCRNMALWKDDEIELPLNPYLAMQLGKGSPEDRAWVISEILRQLRIDSVVLRPKSNGKKGSEKWLLGILVENQIYLFDVQLGLPIPAGSTAAVATLSEAVSHPEWFELMATSEPYKLTAKELENPEVFVMSDSNFWCRRMKNLEQFLPTTDVCVLYDPLIEEEGRSGLLKRVSTVGKWPVDDLKLWPYPINQAKESRKTGPEREQEFQRLTAPFNVPIPFETDSSGNKKLGTPERKMQRYRTDHLLGKFAEATQRYLRIRHLEVEPSPPEIERLNRLASEDALYWTILCKYELGEYATAVDLLSDYLRKYDRKGKWYFAARSVLAQCHAHLGHLPDAIATLERTSSDDPYRTANALRVKRWAASKPQ